MKKELTYKIWWNERGDKFVRTGEFHFDPQDDIGKVHDLMESTAEKMVSPDYNVFIIELIEDDMDALVEGECWENDSD